MKRFALLGLLVLSLFAVNVTTPSPAFAYECPSYTIYCSVSSQCNAYCGGSGGYCYGCCTCIS